MDNQKTRSLEYDNATETGNPRRYRVYSGKAEVMFSLVEMLKYCRPEGSKTQGEFCKRFLVPVFGKPDVHGNYIKTIGESSTMFCAHHDTVHSKDGMQNLVIRNDVVSLPDNSESACLGADCTTGVWIILGMIYANVPGVYVIHAGEEQGCIGSKAIADSYPDWIVSLSHCVAFDRRGFDSVVTQQMGQDTCSDTFAQALCDAIGLDMKPDPTGAYTDSESYAGIIPECTNVSVGYLNQHTHKETQCLAFAETLLERLIAVDWQSLPCVRDPSTYDAGFGQWDSLWNTTRKSSLANESEVNRIAAIIFDYPDDVAELLESYGFRADDMLHDLGIDVSRYLA